MKILGKGTRNKKPETNDVNIGWDGKFKGGVQPMDVYAYTLSVEFFDGKKATKKGDITLIR